MPVGAGGDALRRIEDALVAEDPGLAESFRRWREPHGRDSSGGEFAAVGRFTGVVILLGLATLALEPISAILLLPIWGALLVRTRRSRQNDPAERGEGPLGAA